MPQGPTPVLISHATLNTVAPRGRCAGGTAMKPLNFWLFRGAVIYHVLIIGSIEFGDPEDCLMHCVPCCYEWLWSAIAP